MAAIDVDALVEDIKTAATHVINKDVATIRGFSERQVKAIGQQTALVAEGILTGKITEETREFFLQSIEDMTDNFLKCLEGVLLVTVEKAWNAIVDVVWKAINRAIATTGLVLPVPTK